jgi:cytochrome c556
LEKRGILVDCHPMKSQRIGIAGSAMLLLAVLAGGPVLAHEGAMGITAERMEVMKDMASHMKALGNMLDGRMAYDAAAARAHALALHENCHAAAGQFSEAAHDHHSRAAPAVWQQPEKFRAEMDDLARAVAELVAATASGRRDAMRQPLLDVGRACKSCHETFRLPEE